MVKCGAMPVMYTYPAWTFGGKRRNDDGELRNPLEQVGLQS